MEHKVELAEIEAQAEQFPMEFFLQQQASHYSTHSHSSQLQRYTLHTISKSFKLS